MKKTLILFFLALLAAPLWGQRTYGELSTDELRQAANNGDATAQLLLGVRYDKGDRAPQDYKQAVYWYTQAANQGNATAQYNLGLCYVNGQGVAKDCRQALNWLKKAKAQENELTNFRRTVLEAILVDVERCAETQAPAATPQSTSTTSSTGTTSTVLIEENVDENEIQIFTIVEHDPEFSGGMEALHKYLNQNIQYPQIARDNGITGKVYVTFVVEKDGSITRPILPRDIGGGCGQEAIRVVKSMPKWTPGKLHGKAVRVQYNLPVNFSLK